MTKILKKLRQLNDNEDEKSRKYIFNAYLRENGQRNYIIEGLNNADQNDLILISDVDEIPNLEKINLKNFEKIILFKQDMFYYKFNLNYQIYLDRYKSL